MNNNRYYNPFEFINSGSQENNNTKIEMKSANASKTEAKSSKRAYLNRVDNGERIVINKSIFVIGKNDACNYVITGNNAISRQHAEIHLKNNGVYIVDKKSTNKTFVNGNAVKPENPTKIVNGDEIKLANIKFKLLIE
nr:FHA domain-containing protein [Eubacteriales bacterium]